MVPRLIGVVQAPSPKSNAAWGMCWEKFKCNSFVDNNWKFFVRNSMPKFLVDFKFVGKFYADFETCR